MTTVAKRVNIWNDNPLYPDDKPELVEFFLDDELMVSDLPGKEVDAQIEGILMGLDYAGHDYIFEIEEVVE